MSFSDLFSEDVCQSTREIAIPTLSELWKTQAWLLCQNPSPSLLFVCEDTYATTAAKGKPSREMLLYEQLEEAV